MYSKNIRSILQDKVAQVDPPSSTLQGLERILKDAWSKISPEILENLYRSMPDRVKAVLDAKGGFVIK